jgi:holo-ACP synthase
VKRSPGEAARAASLARILESRERRASLQRRLLLAHGLPVLSLTLVSPGPVKDSPGRRQLMDLAEAALSDELCLAELAVRVRTRVDGPAGPEALWVVDAAPERLKRLAVGVEATRAWGRLLDADVVVLGAACLPEPIDRRGLGLPPRACLLCPDAAAACMGLRRHPASELAAAASSLLLQATGRS